MKYFLLLISLATVFQVYGQSTYLPLNSRSYHYLDRLEILSGQFDNRFFSGSKPVLRKDAVYFAIHIDTSNIIWSTRDRKNIYHIFKNNGEWLSTGEIQSKKSFLKYFYKNQADLYQVKTESFLLKINPVFQFSVGKELDVDEIRYVNTRGLNVRGHISNKVGFYSSLTENQIYPPHYVQRRIKDHQAVPGEGFYKEFKSSFAHPDSGKNGVDFFSATGYITFDAVKNIDVQFGYDRNFIGNGVRSLFLSDFSNPYLFLKLNTKIWRLHYQNLFTELTGQYIRGADTLRPKKYAVFHRLSLNATHWLNIGLFESVVFGRDDGFEFHYLNPVIFYRSIEQDLGSPDNAAVGFDWNALFLKSFSFYGQILLDEFNFYQLVENDGWWGNKFGVQAGLKYIDIAGISNLDMQLEFNQVRPYTYQHIYARNNYTHYNQPLAHPLGANFREGIFKLKYQPFYRFFIESTLLYAMYGTDTTGSNWGGNIFKNYTTREREYNNEIGQGIRNRLTLWNLHFAYMIKQNLYIDLQYTHRNQSSEPGSRRTTNFISGGIRMNIPYKSYYF